MRALRTYLVAAVIASLLIVLTPAQASHDYSFPGNASYSVRVERMDKALACRKGKDDLDGREKHQPVLLVHGTGVTRKQNWGWNYWRTLHFRNFEVCWVALPEAALGDMQIASEYVARAVQVMFRKANEKIDVLGHSQGGIEPRWALKWFAAGRHIGDYIGLASPNHGTRVANEAVALGGCSPACWQLRRGSNFMAALNATTETPGPIHYTSIFTEFDELVQPTRTARLAGARNYLIQDICENRPVDHLGIAGDYVTFRLVMDALKHLGPARLDRAIPDVDAACGREAMPGAGKPPFGTFPNYFRSSITQEEPRLRPYARD